jgi:3',5'-cyclic AMP phosphodiesterase CpdA
MRIAHATDIHWFLPPPLARLFGKRLIGAANLYLAGRRHHFSEAVQDALVAALIEARPDAVVITGDLTATALEGEFNLARARLDPILSTTPTLVQCGNHDVYTTGARRAGRLPERFAPWMHGGDRGIARFDVGALTVIGLDPNRPHLLASGELPSAQLDALDAALRGVADDRRLLLALHYPVVDRRGAPYDGLEHGLRNARALLDVLRACPRKPEAILHGHVHHGYRSEVDLGGVTVPTLNPGSGGYAWLPESNRAAAFSVYTLEPGAPIQVDRLRYDGARFSPEPGGAYATGR